MENTKAVINLDIDKQFFEITEGLVNFEVDFEVKTDNNSPFEIAVVDQKTLDSDQFPYKRIDKGQVNGKVTNDSNRKLPFFMVLKADQPATAHVSLQKQSLPLVGEDAKQPIVTQRRNPTAATLKDSKKSYSEKFSALAKNRTFLITALVVLVAAVWWFRRRKSNRSVQAPVQLAPSVASSPLSPVASPGETNFGF
jgi:hypothetical protein